MAHVLALVDDLFFQAKMAETARQLGVELRTVSTGQALLQHAEQEEPRLVIVDLNAREGVFEALEQLCARKPPALVIAFLSHMQVDLAERARAAGCQRVLARSAFTQSLPAILAPARN